jgi:two-component system, NarL family, nitrate/nitrite response regulator NarL
MKILLADDHHLLRDGLKLLMKRLDDGHGVEIVEADDFVRALELAQSVDGLDLVILDLSMPGMHGLKGLDRMCEACPDVPVVILSGTYDRKLVLDALVRGAYGYIPKTLGGRAILSALQLVLSGEKFVPSIILDNDEQSPTDPHGDGDIPVDNPIHRLTRRERDVLAVLAEGHPNKEIARQLGLQEVTVKVHLKGVFRKLGATNRTQAVRIAHKLGWKS